MKQIINQDMLVQISGGSSNEDALAAFRARSAERLAAFRARSTLIQASRPEPTTSRGGFPASAAIGLGDNGGIVGF